MFCGPQRAASALSPAGTLPALMSPLAWTAEHPQDPPLAAWRLHASLEAGTKQHLFPMLFEQQQASMILSPIHQVPGGAPPQGRMNVESEKKWQKVQAL